MLATIIALFKNEDGATAIEYGLIGATDKRLPVVIAARRSIVWRASIIM
jgi:hypothetical protein